jgi:diguanylate cyclase (GGDEF)-like protein/PAS domain S-box-containing protein
MKDDNKTKKQLVHELTELRSQNAVLKESESAEKYRSLVEGIRDVIYELDSQGVVLYISPAIRDLLGFDSAEIVGNNFIELAHKDDLSSLAEWFTELRKGIEKPYEYRISNKSGEPRWMRTKTRPIMEDGLFKGAHGILIDVTAQRQVEEALRETEKNYRLVINNMADVITVMDMNLRITFVTPSIRRLRGYDTNVDIEEFMERPLEQGLTPESQQNMVKVFEEEMKLEATGTADPGRSRIIELEVYRENGSIFWLENNMSFMRDEAQKLVGIISLSRDITDRKWAEKALRESEERYRELSIVDDLTQLYNSRHFYFQLKIELDRSNRYEQPLTLLLLDLDNFKAFNDAYGHVEGDQVLRRLGQVVKRCLRETDFAYRYGGEEFTILLPMTTSADGSVTAERIRAELKKETFSPVPGQEVHMTVSIGLAQYKPKEDMKAFVHRVDQLMYQGKKSGKDRVCSES